MRVSEPQEFTTRSELARAIRLAYLTNSSRVAVKSVTASLTTEQLWQQVSQLAHKLETSLPINSLVGMTGAPSTQNLVILLACLTAEMCPVIFANEQELRDNKSGAPLAGIFFSGELIVSGGGTPSAAAHPTDAWGLFTSGTSRGERTLVLQATAAVLAIGKDLVHRLEFGQDDSTLVFGNFSHSMVLNTQLLPILLAGGTISFLPAIALKDALALAASQTVSFFSTIPSLLLWLTEHSKEVVLPSVRIVQYAGEPIHQHYLDLARRLFPNAKLALGYGTTETIRVAMSILSRTESWPRTYPIRMLDYEVSQANAETPGGQLVVHSCTAPSRTLQASSNQFLTGDRGTVWPDRSISIYGRSGGLIKIMGVFVDLEEVRCLAESVLGTNVIVRPKETAAPPILNLITQTAVSSATVQSSILRAIQRLTKSKVCIEWSVKAELPRGETGKLMSRPLS